MKLTSWMHVFTNQRDQRLTDLHQTAPSSRVLLQAKRLVDQAEDSRMRVQNRVQGYWPTLETHLELNLPNNAPGWLRAARSLQIKIVAELYVEWLAVQPYRHQLEKIALESFGAVFRLTEELQASYSNIQTVRHIMWGEVEQVDVDLLQQSGIDLDHLKHEILIE